jgi:hypothetical protein
MTRSFILYVKASTEQPARVVHYRLGDEGDSSGTPDPLPRDDDRAENPGIRFLTRARPGGQSTVLATDVRRSSVLVELAAVVKTRPL